MNDGTAATVGRKPHVSLGFGMNASMRPESSVDNGQTSHSLQVSKRPSSRLAFEHLAADLRRAIMSSTDNWKSSPAMMTAQAQN